MKPLHWKDIVGGLRGAQVQSAFVGCAIFVERVPIAESVEAEAHIRALRKSDGTFSADAECGDFYADADWKVRLRRLLEGAGGAGASADDASGESALAAAKPAAAKLANDNSTAHRGSLRIFSPQEVSLALAILCDGLAGFNGWKKSYRPKVQAKPIAVSSKRFGRE